MRSEAKLIGTVGKVETKNGKNGDFTTLSVAVDKGYKNKETNEWVDRTEWFNVVKWGGFPETLTSKLKGALVQITGELVIKPGKEEGEYPQIQIKVLDLDILKFPKKKNDE